MSKSSPKSLYIAKDFDKLTEQLDNTKLDQHKLTVVTVEKTGMNLIKGANEAVKERDEELAFIYFMRFLRLMMIFEENHKSEIKKLKCYSKIKDVLTSIDIIKDSLTKRFYILN